MSTWVQTAKKSQEGDFEKAPPGNHPAVCVAIIDMGTQRNEYKGEVTWQRRAFFVWELVTRKMSGTKGRNHTIGIDLTVSLNEKAKLRGWIEARSGKQIPEGADYDISKELGQPCLLSVVEKNGYPKVNGVSAVPDGLPVPPTQCKPLLLSLDDFQAGDIEIPEWVPYLYGEHIAEHIRRCKEITGDGEHGAVTADTPPDDAPSKFPNSPTVTGRANHPAAQPTPTLPGTPPPDDDGDMTSPGPDPSARWDYHDGTNWIRNVPTAVVQQFITDHKVDSAHLYVKPTGTKDSKRAHEFGFLAPAPY